MNNPGLIVTQTQLRKLMDYNLDVELNSGVISSAVNSFVDKGWVARWNSWGERSGSGFGYMCPHMVSMSKKDWIIAHLDQSNHNIFASRCVFCHREIDPESTENTIGNYKGTPTKPLSVAYNITLCPHCSTQAHSVADDLMTFIDPPAPTAKEVDSPDFDINDWVQKIKDLQPNGPIIPPPPVSPWIIPDTTGPYIGGPDDNTWPKVTWGKGNSWSSGPDDAYSDEFIKNYTVNMLDKIAQVSYTDGKGEEHNIELAVEQVQELMNAYNRQNNG